MRHFDYDMMFFTPIVGTFGLSGSQGRHFVVGSVGGGAELAEFNVDVSVFSLCCSNIFLDRNPNAIINELLR